MRCWVSRALLLSAPLVAACTVGAGEPVDAEPAVGKGTLAVVQLERWAEGAEMASHLVSDAKIARYFGMDGRGVERLLGGHGLEIETCGASEELPEALGAGGASVELLDVGSIDVLFGDQALLLSPRVFPAVAGAAHGVFYVADSEAPLPRAEQDEYVLHAPGNQGLGAFEVTLPAPSFVEELSVAGQTLGASEALMLQRGFDVEVTWAAVDPRDRVELEWAAGGQVLTCVARDDGHFIVPAQQLTQLGADSAAQLTARRVRLTRFDMQGVDVAYVRAVAAASQALTLR